MHPKQEYSHLSIEDDDSNQEELDDGLETLQSPPARKIASREILSHGFAVLCGILLGILLSAITNHILSQSTTSIPPNSYGDAVEDLPATIQTIEINKGFVLNPETGEAECGNNWQEAKALGCHFDVLASRWYSHEYFNGDVLSQMMIEVDFQWFWDENHTQPVEKDIVLKGEFEKVYPLHDFHIMHFLYLWRRLHSALIGHRQLDDDVYSYGHTMHCTRLIMGWKNEKKTNTIATSGIPYCRNKPL